MTQQFKSKQLCDLTYGLKKETKLLPLFKKHFGVKFVKLDRYNAFDFGSIDTVSNRSISKKSFKGTGSENSKDGNIPRKILIELKSRRVNKNQYPSTMVGYNKIQKAIKKIEEGCEVYFTFAFQDCVCPGSVARDSRPSLPKPSKA